MKQVTLYSSGPETTPLAVAFLGLKRRGWRVVLRPAAALPPPAKQPKMPA